MSCKSITFDYPPVLLSELVEDLHIKMARRERLLRRFTSLRFSQ